MSLSTKTPDPVEDLAKSSSAYRFLTLRVDERRYALRAEDVSEVARVPTMTRVPQSPGALLGVANLRGSVLPVASLRGLLGMAGEPVRSDARAVILDVGARLAMVVDSVDALVMVSSERIERRQTELGAEAGERLSGSFQGGSSGGPIKILDIKSLLDAAFSKRPRIEGQARPTSAAQEVEPLEADATKHEILITFDVAGQEFALDLEAVQEVLPAPALRASVPGAEALVLGVAAHRGTLLPLLSLRALLGFPLAQASNAHQKVVVINVGGTKVGLVADGARAIVSAAPELIDPLPPALASRMAGESRIRAIYRGESGRRLISILAPEQLFREDVMQRLNAHRDQKAPETAGPAKAQADGLNCLVFRLGEDEFALPIDAVEEVCQVPSTITRVPKTPKFLEGVVNVRGTVLPVIDQRRRFDMPLAADLKGRRLVVVRTERQRAGLIVDSVSAVLRISPQVIEPAPDLTDEIARLVRGVINLQPSGRIILLLDPLELLTRAERGLLNNFQAANARADG